MYKYFSDKYSETLEKIINDDNLSIEEAMDRIDKIENKIKFKAFGKTTINNKRKDKPGKEEEKEQSEENRAKKVYEEQEE